MPPFDPTSDITAAAQQYGVDPGLAIAIAQQGEGFGHFLGPDARSPAGAVGTMQLMPTTASSLKYGAVDPTDPQQNILGGVRYIRELQDQFGADHPDLIAAGYNGGPGGAARYAQGKPLAETAAYVPRVMDALQPPTPPTADDIAAHLGGVPAPGVPPAPPDAAPPEPPTADDIAAHLRGAQGAFTITPHLENGAWVYRDPSRVPYSRDAADTTLFTDPGGKQYRITNAATPQTPTTEEIVVHPQPPSDLAEVAAGAVKAITGIGDVARAATGEAIMDDANAQMMAADPKFAAQARAQGIDPLALATERLRRQNSPQALADRVLGAVFGYNPEDVQETTLKQRLEQGAGAGLTAGLIPVAEEARLAGMAGNALKGAVGGLFGQGAAEAAPPPLKPLAALAGGVAGVGGLEGGLSAGRSALEGVGAAVSPFRAALSAPAAESQAAGVLARNATDIGQTRGALAGYTPRVPGSPATTFQATGDMGLGALERGAAAQNPAAFREVAGQQNAARINALTGIQQGGSATDLSSGLQQGELAARAAEGKLWKAVDPDGSMTGNVGATKDAAQSIQAAIPKTARPPSGEEANIYQAAGELAPVAPLQDLIALRSRVSDAMREELRSNGQSAAYARLTQLRGAIQANLSQTIGDKVASDDAAVQSGALPQAQSARAQLQQILNDAAVSGQSVRLGRSTLVAGQAPGGTASAFGDSGTAGATGRPAPGAFGNPQGAGVPSFDAAAQQRLAAATQATKERARVFSDNPIVQKIGPLANGADVTNAVGQVLGSKTSVRDMGALAEAAQKSPGGLDGLRQAVADHIGNRLIGNTEAGTTGIPQIKADQFQTFVKNNRPALAKVFTSQELDTLDNIAADIQQSNRSISAVKLPGGSNTAQDTSAMSKFGGQLAKGGVKLGIDLLGALVGAHFGGGEVGGPIGFAASEGMQQLRAAGVSRVNDLVTQALLNPEVAQRLLARLPADAAGQRNALNALVRALGNGAARGVIVNAQPTESKSRMQARSALAGIPMIPPREPINALQGIAR